MHTIDAKNRMSLPAAFRQQLQQPGPDDEAPKPPIITNASFCLDLYAHEDWVRFEEQIVSIASVDPEAQAYARMMISGATECPIDKQGRILVPPHLREYAGLKRDVTVAGVGPKIELWDTARFEANLHLIQSRFEGVAQSVAGKLAS